MTVEQEQAAARERGRQAIGSTNPGYRASEHFDWRKARRLTRKTLRDIYHDGSDQ